MRFYNFMTIYMHTFCLFFGNLNIHQKVLFKSQEEMLYRRSSKPGKDTREFLTVYSS